MDASEAKMRLGVIRKALQYARSGTVFTRNEMFASAPDSTREFTRKILQRLVKEGALRRVQLPGESTSHYRVHNVDFFTDLLKSDEALADFIWPGQKAPTVEQLSSLVKEVEADPESPTLKEAKEAEKEVPQLVLIKPVPLEPFKRSFTPVIDAGQDMATPPTVRKRGEFAPPQVVGVMPGAAPQAPQTFTPVPAPNITPDSLAATNKLLEGMVTVHKEMVAVHKELLDLLGAAFQSIIYTRDKLDAVEKDVAVMKAILEKLV